MVIVLLLLLLLLILLLLLLLLMLYYNITEGSRGSCLCMYIQLLNILTIMG